MTEIITNNNDDVIDHVTTVKTTDGQFANKIIDRNDGHFSKSAGANHAHFFAWTVPITNFAVDFPAVLNSLGYDEAIILGWVPGTEHGATFELYSRKKLNRALSRPEEDRPIGLYKIDGVTVCARLQENFRYSRITLFDVDPVEAMRDELRVRDLKHFEQMMARIHPSFAGVTMLCVPSASNRVIVNNEPVMCSGSMHIYVQRADNDPGDRWAHNLLIHAFEAGYVYMKPSYYRKGERKGQICAQTPASIWDQTTLKGSNRLDFAGMPALTQNAYDAGARIVPPEMMIIQGGAWDSKTVTLPPTDVVTRFTQETNTSVKIKKEKIDQALSQTGDGLLGAVAQVEITSLLCHTLTIDTECEIESGGTLTVGTFMAGAEEKVRCQAFWRESDTMNAFLTKRDGLPMAYDNGSHIAYTLQSSDVLDYHLTVAKNAITEASEDPGSIVSNNALTAFRYLKKESAADWMRTRARLKAHKDISITALESEIDKSVSMGNGFADLSGGRREGEELTHNEIAGLLRNEISDAHNGNVLTSRGSLYTCQNNIWTPSSMTHVVTAVRSSQYDGEELCKTGGSYEAIARLVYVELEDETFFDDGAKGVAIGDQLYYVKPEGIFHEPLCPAHRCVYRLNIGENVTDKLLFDMLLTKSFSHKDPQRQQAQIMVLQEAIGCALIPGMMTHLQKVIMLLGVGSSGKSVLLNILGALFPPEFVTSISPHDWDNEYYKASLANSVLNIVPELDATKAIPAADFKAISAGDSITGRDPCGKPFPFRPTSSHWFNANSFINTRDHTSAFFRRWQIIHFANRVSDAEQDIHLADKIIASELGAIVMWALEGAVRVKAQNGFTQSLIHEEKMNEWQTRTNNVMSFLFDCEARYQIVPSGINTRGYVWPRRNYVYARYLEYMRDKPNRRFTAANFYDMLENVPGLSNIKVQGVRRISGLRDLITEDCIGNQVDVNADALAYLTAAAVGQYVEQRACVANQQRG